MSETSPLTRGLQLGFLDPQTRERRLYTVQAPLGKGAFTLSYLASSEGGFAVLKSALGGEAPVDLAPEAKLHRRLDHPNLVRFRGTALDPQWRTVLAFERLFPNPLLLYSKTVDTERLGSHLGGRYHPLPAAIALDLAMDLLSGLAHLHQAGYVHADVKPSNFLLALPREHEEVVAPRAQLQDLRRGRARGVLIDLGSCWSHDASAANPTEATRRGPQLTPLYAPPEALLSDEGSQILHPTMDTYSAALVLYQNLTGHMPYAHLPHAPSSGEGLLDYKRQELQGGVAPVDLAVLDQVAGYTLKGMRRSEFLARLRELLLAWLAPDPERRTTIPKARQQLQEAFAFRANAEGAQRQSVVGGHLVIPHET